MLLRHLLLFLSAFLAFGLTARGGVDNTDVTISTQAARAWWLRGSPAILDDASSAETGVPTWNAERGIASYIDNGKYGLTGENGRRYVWFPIGHQALLVACVATARGLEESLPDPQGPARLVPYEGDHAVEAFWTAFLASWLPVFGAALGFVALASIAVTLGANRREALLTAVIATFCTQFWPGSNEAMSNMPGAGFALPSIAMLLAWLKERGDWRHLLAGAVLSSLAVAVRYPSALFLLPFWLAVVSRCLRGRDLRSFGVFVAGGAPIAIALATSNWIRFGSPTETGYSPGAGFGGYPAHLGLASILVSPGKGILWFSPILVWLSVRLVKARQLPAWMPTLGLLAPVALFSTVVYWDAGQCWGIRYLSATIALFVTWTLTRLRPFGERRRSLIAIALLGALISAGGILTSYVPYQAVVSQVGSEWYPEAQPESLNLNTNWDPRLSPFHGHWRYFVADRLGHVDTADAAPFTRSMFGAELVAESGEPSAFTLPPTANGLRHLWWRRLEIVFPEFPGTRVALIWFAATALISALAAWLWCRTKSAPDTEVVADAPSSDSSPV